MADVVSQQVTDAGLAPVYEAATNLDDVECGDEVIMHVVNGGAGEITVTIETPGTVSGLGIADRTVAIPAGTSKFIGPLRPGTYKRTDTGRARFTYSSLVSVTRAALKI